MNTSISTTLSKGQRSKLRAAYKQKRDVTILLSKEQIQKNTGQDKISLSQRQWNAVQKNKTKGRGYRLNISYNQLKQNQKGGFLPLIFAGIGALASLMGGGAAIANSVIEYKDKKKTLEELVRHNKAMEALQKGGKLKMAKKNKSRKVTKNVFKKKIKKCTYH